MKNLTLRIDEKTLAEARKLAALEGTTVAKLVREFLTALVEKGEAGLTSEEARREIVELVRPSRLAPRDWNRDKEDIYEERVGFAEAPSSESVEMTETTAARLPTLEEMTRDTGAPPEPGHDEWFRRQVRQTLDKKKAGKLEYHDLSDIAAEFGFDAR